MVGDRALESSSFAMNQLGNLSLLMQRAKSGAQVWSIF
jgi:hypothetical protein